MLHAFARITPSDERIRVALKFSDLPHAVYVLSRIEGVADPRGFDVEHIVPPAPHDGWSGDGVRAWSDYSEDEQNSHRALAGTLGNLTLLEEPLAARVFGAPFPDKRDVYRRSRVDENTALAGLGAWNTASIAERTAALTDAFVQIWRRPAVVEIDDDGLTPILDAVRRRGWPAGWDREFDYVEYRGERWDVPDVKYLFNRVFRRGWTDTREALDAFNARNGGPIYDAQAWNGPVGPARREPFPLHGLGLEVHDGRGAGAAFGVGARRGSVREVLLHRERDVMTTISAGPVLRRRMMDLTLEEHTLTVPLVWSDPADTRTIDVFASVVTREGGEDLPYLVFLQGGPGSEAPRAMHAPASPAWLDQALAHYRVVMLDQRGTGRSTPVGDGILERRHGGGRRAPHPPARRRDRARLRGDARAPGSRDLERAGAVVRRVHDPGVPVHGLGVAGSRVHHRRSQHA